MQPASVETLVPIYLTQPELVELCGHFLHVIEDSLQGYDYGRALELGREWLNSLDCGLEDAKLPDQKGAIRLWRAELLVQLQRWDQASEELDGLLCRRSGLSEKHLLARGLILLAQIHGMYGEQEQAQQALQQSQFWDSQGLFEVQWQLEKARLLIRSGELEAALELLPLGGHDERDIERGRVLFRLQRFREAEEAWLSVAESERSPADRFQAEAWRLLGLLHQEMGQAPAALEYLEKALRTFWALQMWIGVAKSYEGLGQVCSDLGRPTEALHFTHKAERLSRRLGAESELAVVYGRLGNLCMKLGDLPRAIRFHQLDVDMCRRFGNYRALAYALSSLGLSYRAQGDNQQACELLSESLDRFLQLAERGPILRVRIERGRTLIERNLLAEAGLDLQAAGWMLGQGTSMADSAQIYVLTARLERLRGNPDLAEQSLKFAHDVLGQVPKDAAIRCEALREKGYLCLGRGDLEGAAGAFASATAYARKGEQHTIWLECLEQLDRLDELQGAEAVLEGLHRGNRDSGEFNRQATREAAVPAGTFLMWRASLNSTGLSGAILGL